MSNQNPDVFNKLDEDVAGDVGDEGYVAPDEPMGSHAFGTTAAEELKGETFDQRDKHTVPEVGEEILAEDAGQVGQLLHGDDDADTFVDDEADEVASDEGSVVDMSAEEQAMHITEV